MGECNFVIMNSLLKVMIFILSFSKIHEATCSPINGSVPVIHVMENRVEPAPRFEADKDVKFLLYTKKNPTEAQTISVGEGAWLGNFDAQHKTKVIIHGWQSKPSNFDGFRNGYFQDNDDYNIILVDWSKGASNLIYSISRGHVVSVGEFVGKLLDTLVAKGLSTSLLHTIGHSLGAHIAGIAANRMQKGKPARVTGLDPAGPLFGLGESAADRLDQSDAEFVDVIHTCAGVLGWENPMGHADFYPNGGKMVQPGCGKDLADLGLGSCSHARSHVYYEESITSKIGFVGVQCTDWEAYKKGDCSNNAKALMGEKIPTSTKGKFYLKTGSSAPYAEG